MIVTFCKTKAGKGFKVVVDGKWLYVSMNELFKVIQDKSVACVFREIHDDKE